MCLDKVQLYVLVKRSIDHNTLPDDNIVHGLLRLVKIEAVSSKVLRAVCEKVFGVSCAAIFAKDVHTMGLHWCGCHDNLIVQLLTLPSNISLELLWANINIFFSFAVGWSFMNVRILLAFLSWMFDYELANFIGLQMYLRIMQTDFFIVTRCFLNVKLGLIFHSLR
ncbi:unnamed protein product [Ilex paraguariensis]|uniref:Uncharacterized protein n=1 Tax=Ilex paraguariensis TaxID=185542 RepID=A0ABC8QXD0_9AQUA